MCGYFCIGFTDFMLKSKTLLEYTNLFSPNEYKKNDKLIFLLNSKNVKTIKICCIVCDKYRKFKNPKMSYAFKNTSVISTVWSKCVNKL